MKDLYEALIEGIPEDEPLDEVFSTHYGALAFSRGRVGLSEFPDGRDTRPRIRRGDPGKRTLRELAAGVKSWNFTEAAMGVAAMNAYYNSPEMAERNGIRLSTSSYVEDRNADPFIAHQKAAMGKKVVVLGHFPYMEQLLKPVCDLFIIHRFPWKGDYPEPAIDYLVPGSAFVFIGARYFLDKSLPHILQLAEGAYVGLVGPATVLSPVLFDYGVDELDGFIPKDVERAVRIQKEQESGKIYSAGEKVSLRKTEYHRWMNSDGRSDHGQKERNRT